MANENNFKETVNSLFKGMDSFIAAKNCGRGTDSQLVIPFILPLVDVGFWRRCRCFFR